MPSETTCDLAAIRARQADREIGPLDGSDADEASADCAALLAEVERLTTERDDARREAMKWNVVADRVADEAARLRGGATTWPALDFDACRRLYADLHEALAQYGDPDDANRVRDFNAALREHLPVSRGGATAPTPDHLMAIRRFLMNWVRPGNRVNAERELLNLLGLRRDTGASHEQP